MDKTALRSATRFLIFGDSTNTSYADTDLDLELEQAYHELIEIISRYCGKWQLGDTYAIENLTENVFKYPLMTDVLRIKRVQIKPLNSMAEYLLSTLVDNINIPGDLDNYKPSTPVHDLRKNYLTFHYGGTIETVTNGIKIDYEDELSLVNAPELPSFARRFLVLKAAITYCTIWELPKINLFKTELHGDTSKDQEEARGGLLGLIKSHYSNRAEAQRPNLSFKKRNLR